MSKNKIKQEKAITLIALVVSIIVLLILAGVSIAVLTGENGILNRATDAKQTNEQKTAEEELKLGIVSLSTDYYSKTTRPSTFREFIFTEESEADLNKYLSGTATFDDTNYTITYKNILYEVEENGTISKSEGIILDKTNIDNLQIVTNGTNVTYGETTINATTVNLTGNITWSVKNNSSVVLLTPSADGKSVTVKANQAGSATIVASCSGKTKECSVTVTSVTAVTSITLDKSSGTVNAGDNFVITATTNGTEDLTWSWEKTSGTTSLEITTSGTGKTIGTIVGSGAGTAVVTVSAPNATAQTCTITVQEVGYFKTIVTDQETGDGVAYYFTGSTDTTGVQITADPDDDEYLGNYLGMKVNYTPLGTKIVSNKTIGTGKRGNEEESTYRIFFIDINGEYGPKGTIYLKADDDENYMSLKALDVATEATKMQQFNKIWWNDTTYCNTSNNNKDNKVSVNKLLDPTKWTEYMDEIGDNQIANYVVGAPSLEMWVDSYNAFLRKNREFFRSNYGEYDNKKYIYTTTPNTNGTYKENTGAGYFVGQGSNYPDEKGFCYGRTNATIPPSGFLDGSIAKDRAETWDQGSGHYWLASPSASFQNLVLSIAGGGNGVRYADCQGTASYSASNPPTNSICPVVCCNPRVAIYEKL